jgi:hypothetical protein
MKVTYSSNNSGGSWWLSDQNWYDLEKAGWTVLWVKDQEHYKKWVPADKLATWDGRWLGCLAKEAFIEAESVDVAIAKWEHVTGQYASDEGCPCCGQPHYFYEGD